MKVNYKFSFLLISMLALGLFALVVVQKREEARVTAKWRSDIATYAARAESAATEARRAAAVERETTLVIYHAADRMAMRKDSLQDQRLQHLEEALRVNRVRQRDNARADSARQEAIEAQARLIQRIRSQIGIWGGTAR